MTKTTRNAFTLIEVMVAVLIVSVVIGALWQMQGNTAKKLQMLEQMQEKNQYMTLLLDTNDKYGFDSSSINLYSLVDSFDLPSDLRRALKHTKATISYDIVTSIDDNDSMVLEVGRSKLKFKDTQLSILRMRLQ